MILVADLQLLAIIEETNAFLLGRVAALARSHLNGLLPIERIIEQTTGTMPLAPNTIAIAILEDQRSYKLTRAAEVLASVVQRVDKSLSSG